MKSSRLGFILAVLACGLAWPVHATVTLEFYFEDGTIPDGALAALVADTGEDGFLTMSDPGVSGTPLAVGSGVGGGNDIILSLMNASSGPEWHSGAGIGDTLASIDYDAFGVTEGMALAIYVFPDLTRQDDNLIIGDRFTIYRKDSVGASGGSIPFEAPADPGVYTLSVLTAGNGGDFDPGNPGNDESYETGNAGVPAGPGPDDHGNSRRDATPISDNQRLPGNLTAGDLDFFRLDLAGQSFVLVSSEGAGFSRGLIFDANGNLIGEATPANGALLFGDPLDPGTYFLAIIGDGNNQNEGYELSLKNRPILIVRPDITIGKTMGGQRGDGFYSATGAGQTYAAKSKNGKKVQVIFSVGNDGDLPFQVGVAGSRSNAFYKLNYFKLSGGFGNVTSQVTRGGFSADYRAMERHFFKVRLKPTAKGKKRRKRGKFSVDATARALRDRAAMKVKITGR